ncbi:hypothetical protein LR48_Vigan07g167500 [Vigna angularis]|uniref:Putative plant transposon protein domain-containing protein n=1 Tax=Phaseolus angularis TaxID=3914 RepID=A0A0L9UZ64_PHAAN|nr:hypothetical protein LR48_Vigan07g167500 [Vigna angularis]
MGRDSPHQRTRGNKKEAYEKPLPHSKKYHRKEKKFERFMEIFKKLEIKVPMIETLKQFGEQLENRNWERLATYPAPANIAVVKEFYTNGRRLGDYPTEEYMSYVRGHDIRYEPDAINRFLNTEWADARMQSIHRVQVATTEMIIGMYDSPLGHRWTMEEFKNVVAWREEKARASEARAAEAPAMDDDDEFEDAEDDGEEEDSDDSMG